MFFSSNKSNIFLIENQIRQIVIKKNGYFLKINSKRGEKINKIFVKIKKLRFDYVCL